jgi:hypothetical protein
VDKFASGEYICSGEVEEYKPFESQKEVLFERKEGYAHFKLDNFDLIRGTYP